MANNVWDLLSEKDFLRNFLENIVFRATHILNLNLSTDCQTCRDYLYRFLGFSLFRFIRGVTYFERGRKYLRQAGVLLEIVGTIGDYNSIRITSSLKKLGSVGMS